MLPSGEQIAIAHGDQRVVITEVGATLRTYVTAGVPVVEGFAADEIPDAGRNQVGYPWVNRVGDGEWTFSGRVGRASVDNVAQGTAAHGIARWRPFKLMSANQNRCSLSLLLHPTPEYPFATELKVDYHLGPMGLTVTSTVTNLDDVPIPFSLGFSPFLAVTTPTIEGAVLSVPARAYIPLNDRKLPTGEILPVMGNPLDFREGKSVNGHSLDVTYCELDRDDSGMCTVSLCDSSGGEINLSQDRNFPYVQVFSGDSLPVGRRRTSVAIAPMTAPPDALRSGKDLIVLEPGMLWAGSWRVRRVH
jgi:aldose 1-epimerase